VYYLRIEMAMVFHNGNIRHCAQSAFRPALVGIRARTPLDTFGVSISLGTSVVSPPPPNTNSWLRLWGVCIMSLQYVRWAYQLAEATKLTWWTWSLYSQAYTTLQW